MIKKNWSNKRWKNDFLFTERKKGVKKSLLILSSFGQTAGLDCILPLSYSIAKLNNKNDI
jgi:hypothetical protein